LPDGRVADEIVVHARFGGVNVVVPSIATRGATLSIPVLADLLAGALLLQAETLSEQLVEVGGPVEIRLFDQGAGDGIARSTIEARALEAFGNRVRVPRRSRRMTRSGSTLPRMAVNTSRSRSIDAATRPCLGFEPSPMKLVAATSYRWAIRALAESRPRPAICSRACSMA
jgi:hypothetical protein